MLRPTRYFLGAALVAVAAAGAIIFPRATTHAIGSIVSPATIARVMTPFAGARHTPTPVVVTRGSRHAVPPHPATLPAKSHHPVVASPSGVTGRHNTDIAAPKVVHTATHVTPASPARPRTTASPPPAQKETCPLYPSTTTISIPRLSEVVPVYDCDTDATGHLPIAPTRSVTHWYRSAALGMPGNYVLYGHDDIEGDVFANLPLMQVGDHITISTGGRHVVYVVTGRSIVSPYATSVLQPTSAATLTMISCYPMYVDSQRIVVTAALQSG